MLTITGLSKSATLRKDPILQDINLQLAEGEFCIIIGSNGSGKSSLLKTISGEYTADTGEIYLNNISIASLPMHTRASMIGSVVQDISKITMSEMTLLENMVVSYLRDKNPSLGLYSNYAPQIHKILSTLNLGLEKYLYQPMASLSGGQRQIIATLMAIISDTKLLLLDEHTSALDAKTQLSMMRYTVDKIESKKITTLMVTHNLTDAIEYGDRIIILHHGKIAFDIKSNEKLTMNTEHLLRILHSLEDIERY